MRHFVGANLVFARVRRSALIKWIDGRTHLGEHKVCSYE